MMKIKNLKLASLIMALVMVLTCVPSVAFAEELIFVDEGWDGGVTEENDLLAEAPTADVEEDITFDVPAEEDLFGFVDETAEDVVLFADGDAETPATTPTDPAELPAGEEGVREESIEFHYFGDGKEHEVVVGQGTEFESTAKVKDMDVTYRMKSDKATDPVRYATGFWYTEQSFKDNGVADDYKATDTALFIKAPTCEGDEERVMFAVIGGKLYYSSVEPISVTKPLPEKEFFVIPDTKIGHNYVEDISARKYEVWPTCDMGGLYDALFKCDHVGCEHPEIIVEDVEADALGHDWGADVKQEIGTENTVRYNANGAVVGTNEEPKYVSDNVKKDGDVFVLVDETLPGYYIIVTTRECNRCHKKEYEVEQKTIMPTARVYTEAKITNILDANPAGDFAIGLELYKLVDTTATTNTVEFVGANVYIQNSVYDIVTGKVTTEDPEQISYPCTNLTGTNPRYEVTYYNNNTELYKAEFPITSEHAQTVKTYYKAYDAKKGLLDTDVITYKDYNTYQLANAAGELLTKEDATFVIDKIVGTWSCFKDLPYYEAQICPVCKKAIGDIQSLVATHNGPHTWDEKEEVADICDKEMVNDVLVNTYRVGINDLKAKIEELNKPYKDAGLKFDIVTVEFPKEKALVDEKTGEVIGYCHDTPVTVKFICTVCHEAEDTLDLIVKGTVDQEIKTLEEFEAEHELATKEQILASAKKVDVVESTCYTRGHYTLIYTCPICGDTHEEKVYTEKTGDHDYETVLSFDGRVVVDNLGVETGSIYETYINKKDNEYVRYLYKELLAGKAGADAVEVQAADEEATKTEEQAKRDAMLLVKPVVARKCKICGHVDAIEEKNIETVVDYVEVQGQNCIAGKITLTATLYKDIDNKAKGTLLDPVTATFPYYTTEQAYYGADAHRWGEWEIDGEVAADGSYTEVIRCQVCGEIKESRFVPAPTHQHSVVLVEEDPATCTENGTKAYYYCSGCQNKYADAECNTQITDEELVIPALGHSIVEVAEVPATTEAEGVKAHFECERCGKYFADAEGTTEVDPADYVIEKLPKEEEPTVEVPGKVTIKSTSTYVGTGAIKVKVGAVEGADSYKIGIKEAGTKDYTTKTAKDMSVLFDNVKFDGKYVIRAYAKNAAGKGEYSYKRRWVHSVNVALTAGKGSIVVNLDGEGDAYLYKIRVSTTKDMADYVTYKTTKTSYTITGLESGQTYYVRAIPYVKVDGKVYRGAMSSRKHKMVE